MKIRKTKNEVELEITPEEVERWYSITPPGTFAGIAIWVRQQFGLDLLMQIKTKKE